MPDTLAGSVLRQVICLNLDDPLSSALAQLAQLPGRVILVLDENSKPVMALLPEALPRLWLDGVTLDVPLGRVAGMQICVVPQSCDWYSAATHLEMISPNGILVVVNAEQKLLGVLSEEDVYRQLGMAHLAGSQQLLQALSDSELRLHAVFNATQILLGLLDPAGTLLEVNNAGLALIDAARDEVIGKPFWDTPWWTHDPEQRERLRTAIARCREGETTAFEVSHRADNGQLYFIEFCIRPVYDDAGVVRYLLPEGRDITSRRQVENRLAHERMILRSVLDTIPDLVFYKDINSVYLGCNRAFEKYFGRPESQIVGRTDYFFVDTESANYFREKDQQAMAAPESRTNEEWVNYPDGRKVLLETTKAPIRDAAGRLMGLLGISRDITERRRLDSALRQSEARYRLLFENMTSGFALHEVILDLTGKPIDYRFLQVNPAFERMVGLSAEQLIGYTVREVFPNVENYWIDTYGQVALSGKPVSLENYAQEGNRWYSSYAFCPQKGQFAAVVNDVTDRRETEEQMRRQKAQLRAILDNFPFMVWLKDKNSHYLAANIEMARACGVASPEAMIGHGDEDYWPADIAAKSRADDLAIMDSLERCVLEEQVDNTGRWLETFKTPILDEMGALLGTVGFARDITERKREETQLLASHEHYRALLDASPVGVIELDASGNCVYVNRRYSEITGLTPQKAFGEGWKSGIHPADLPEALRECEAGMHERGSGSMEYRHILPEGEIVWVFSQGAAMYDGDGKMTGAIVTMTDITKRREYETQLRLAASMFDASSEGIIVLDAGDRIVSINPAFSALLGYESADVLGLDIKANFDAERHPDALRKIFVQGLAESDRWQGEVWGRHKDGRDLALWMSINTLRNNNGELQWRFVLFSDITDRKRAEELIWRQANYDSLTGLPNRRLFRDRLQQEIRKSKRSGRILALFFVDLDHFKEVNDSLGHDCGDRLLVEAGERIGHCVRQYDTVARLGGDEFTVILADMPDQDRASDVALAILQVLATPFLLDGQEACVSASIGIAFYPQDGLTDLDLLKQADRAMYFAKAKGRNCFATLHD